MRVYFALSFAIVAISTSAQALSTLPLKHGYYVRAELPCDAPENKSYITYEGPTFGEYELGCDITSITKSANIYTVKNHCSYAGDDYGEEIRVLTITDEETFEQNGSTYRFCQ